jgi:hypothetical protein
MKFKIANAFNGHECQDHDDKVIIFYSAQEAQDFIAEHRPWMGIGALAEYSIVVPEHGEYLHDWKGGGGYPKNSWQCGDYIFRAEGHPHGSELEAYLIAWGEQVPV